MAPLADRVSVVCFDLGGVLVRICRSWPEAVETAGLDLRTPGDVNDPLLVERRRKIVGEHATGRISNEAYYQAMSDAFEGLYSPADMERIHHAWSQETYSGVERLVRELNAVDGLVTACLSNTNDAHWQRLVSSEYTVVGLLQHQLASHELNVAKPDPEIYARAAEVFGVNAARIVFFDDLEENVAAARSAGWQAERVDPHGDTAAQMRAHLTERDVL